MDKIRRHWENLPESKYELATHDIEYVDYETCANPNYVEWLESKLEEAVKLLEEVLKDTLATDIDNFLNSIK